MDTLLILAGLLLILAGYVWLIILAFERGPLWGLACVLPPLAPLFLARHWDYGRKAVVLGALGGIPLVVGLAMLASHDGARLEAILRLQWLRSETVVPDLAIALRGELDGKPFAPQQAELIDGVLSLREGDDFYARRELQIRLRQPVTGALRLDVLPEDKGPLPDVEISWLAPDSDLPEARRLNHGYSLHLDLQPEAPNRLRGVFHLVLPTEYRTSLTGEVELYTDRLRYRNGVVDTHYDSLDTLAYVARDYLERRFPDNVVALSPLPHVDLQRHELALPVAFTLDGRAEQLELSLQRSENRGWAVRDDHYPKRSTHPAASKPAEPTTAVRAPAPRPAYGLLPIERLQADPQRFINRSMRVTTESGRSAQGIFTGLDQEGRLVIRQVLSGPGEVSYSLRPDEIVQVELLAP
ncbi:hypothetical protein PKB_3471 [Pseudomonas knackmussii B13]|uniref:Uncharacterized protein n=1 Tax=Pseudomonas knackmussii (strain DSM 6978 / CCUG 54928 / LMG 23759 / B13) TaxID=1301098 RepID=A0A024HJI6_PSEKB|nr:MFS transporter [Pseudomonas knackmussii]CDF84814.1 hypothetical protein PKB_3471 [Pseudomonas knackmussii B13]